jgi:hypothetical protein
MRKKAAYLYFGYKPFRRQLDFSCLVSRGDFFMVDEMIPTLTTYVHVLTPILGMPLNFFKDVVVRLCGIGSLVLFLAAGQLWPPPIVGCSRASTIPPKSSPEL